MKRYFKSFKLIFIAFIFMSLFYSLEISKFGQTKLKFIEENNFFTYDSKTFHIDGSNEYERDFISILSEYNGIMIQKKYLKYKQFTGSEIYFNYDNKYKPNILNGRFFDISDFQSDEALAVIGKNLDSYIEVQDGVKYFELEDVKYRVIGEMGGDESSLNDKFIVNMNGKNMSNSKISNESFYQIESKDKDINLIYNLENKLKSKYSSAKILLDSSLEIQNPISGYIKSRMYYFIFIISIFVISTIHMASFYMAKRENEIGILKAIGIKNKRIFTKILFEYQLVTIVSFSIGLIIHFIIYNIKYKNYLYYTIDFNNLIYILCISILTGFLTCLFPLLRLLKISPVNIMKR